MTIQWKELTWLQCVNIWAESFSAKQLWCLINRRWESFNFFLGFFLNGISVCKSIQEIFRLFTSKFNTEFPKAYLKNCTIREILFSRPETGKFLGVSSCFIFLIHLPCALCDIKAFFSSGKGRFYKNKSFWEKNQ